MKKKDKKTMSTAEWFKGMTVEEFKEVFIEWYIPAIKSKFITLEERIKKLEKPGKGG